MAVNLPKISSRDVLKSIYPWVFFAGSVLIVAVFYWAQVVLVPVALAGLLTFFLTPVVTRLQRWLGRVPAVLTITIILSCEGNEQARGGPGAILFLSNSCPVRILSW
jgi:hypothetical protein